MRYGILLITFWLGMGTTLLAQDAETITLQEAIDIALENNYRLQQARNNVQLSETGVLSAKADFLPSVNGSFSGSQTAGQQFNEAIPGYENVTTHSLNAGLNARVDIFQGFRNILNLRRSQYNQDIQEENRQWTRESVIFSAASNYLQVILNEELLKIARENLESTKKQLEQIQAQVDVGSVPVSDLYNQESIVASNELEVIRRENALSFSRTQLIGTLQLDPQGEYEFVTPELEELDPTPTDVDLSSLINQALANRSDLRAQELLIQSNKQELGIARSNYYPVITAEAGINTRYNDTYFGPLGTVSFQDQFFDQFVNKYIGFTFNLPIFNNFNTRLNVQNAQINYRNSQLEYENLKFSIYEEVRQAYNDYISYSKELESSGKALRAARRTYETEQERYNVGAGTLIELSNANAQFVQAQSDRAQALFRFTFQQKLLDYYLGKLNEDITFN